MPDAKRQRGGQPRNQNARKHGLYARYLSDDQMAALTEASRLSPSDLRQEIALLRSRLPHLIDAAPHRIDLLAGALRTLAQLVAVNARLSPVDTRDLSEWAAETARRLHERRPAEPSIETLLSPFEDPL